VSTPSTPPGGIVYLLHFDPPYRHAKHYIGYSASSGFLKARLAAHERGQGARLLEVVHEAGIGWQLARTWPGTPARERQIKRQGGASRCCPMCGVTPRTPRQPAGQPTSVAEPDPHTLAYLAANG
jgi:hypothetical protein